MADDERPISDATVIAWQSMPLCERCYERYQAKHKLPDKRDAIRALGEGVVKRVIEPGDAEHFPDPFDDVTILYELRVQGRYEVVDSHAASARMPLTFKAGCSGPVLHVQILSGHRLFQVSKYDIPDPYVTVYWGAHKLGSTRVRDGTVDPVWGCESFVVPIDADKVKHIERAATRGSVRYPTGPRAGLPLLRAEVYDYNLASRDDFIGQVVLSELQIIRVVALGESEARVFPLQPKLAQGTMQLSAARAGLAKDAAQQFIVVCGGVRVAGCEELASADAFSASDPYLAAFWDGDPIGETVALQDDQSPTWADALFAFPVPARADGGKCKPGCALALLRQCLGRRTLRLEVRDWDRFGEHKILGEVVLDSGMLCQLIQASERAGRKRSGDSKAEAEKARANKEAKRAALGPLGRLRARLRGDGSGEARGAAARQAATAAGRLTTCVVAKRSVEFTWGHYLPCMRDRRKDVEKAKKVLDFASKVPLLKAPAFAAALYLPLELGAAHNGSSKISGTLGMRLIYSTRGLSLRGLDEGVQQMSLGERATLVMRPDYAFDSAQPGPHIPPGAVLEAEVFVAAINNRTAWAVHYRRLLQVTLRAARNRLYRQWERFEDAYPRLARVVLCLVAVLWLAWRAVRPLLWVLSFPVCGLCRWRARVQAQRVEVIRRARLEKTMQRGAVQREFNNQPAFDDDEEDDEFGEDDRPEDEDILDFQDEFTDAELAAAHREAISGARHLFSGGTRHRVGDDLAGSLSTGLVPRTPADAASPDFNVGSPRRRPNPTLYLDE